LAGALVFAAPGPSHAWTAGAIARPEPAPRAPELVPDDQGSASARVDPVEIVRRSLAALDGEVANLAREISAARSALRGAGGADEMLDALLALELRAQRLRGRREAVDALIEILCRADTPAQEANGAAALAAVQVRAPH
jgi:hypothetical protein